MLECRALFTIDSTLFAVSLIASGNSGRSSVVVKCADSRLYIESFLDFPLKYLNKYIYGCYNIEQYLKVR